MNIGNWLWDVALKKSLGRLSRLAVAWLLSLGIQKYGLTLDNDLAETALTGGLFSAIEYARNWLKWGRKPVPGQSDTLPK